MRGCCFAQGRREEELLRHDTKRHFTIRSEDAFLPLPGSVVIRAPEQTWNVLTLAAPTSQHRKGPFLPSFPSFCQPAFLHRSALHLFLTTCLSLTSWLLEYCPGRSTSRARQVLLTVIAANPIEIANLWLQQKFGLAIPTYETSRLLFLAFVFLRSAFNISSFIGRLLQLRHGDLFEKVPLSGRIPLLSRECLTLHQHIDRRLPQLQHHRTRAGVPHSNPAHDRICRALLPTSASTGELPQFQLPAMAPQQP